jgi:hypothetical protein
MELLVFLPLMALGFSAPLGATALGLLALREIRQSGRTLKGFGLALADLLLFPALGLNGWVAWLGFRLVSQLRRDGAFADLAAVAALVIFALGVALNLVLMRAILRRARLFVASPPVPPGPARQGTWRQVLKQCGVRWALLVAAQLALLETLNQASLEWKESTAELWGLALMTATLGGLLWGAWPGFVLKRSVAFVAGALVCSAFLLLAVDNVYAWWLRPKLGLLSPM